MDNDENDVTIRLMEKINRKEYAQIHVWLNETFGKAVACENPECEGDSERVEYALKAGKTHKRLRGNYMTLCCKCHRRYDIKHNNKGHQEGKAEPRLSMKLLRSLATEYGMEHNDGLFSDFLDASAFLDFVEKKQRPVTRSTTVKKSISRQNKGDPRASKSI